MAKIVEEIVVIKVSKIVRDSKGEDSDPIVSNAFVAAIEEMAVEVLNDPTAVIEVERG